MESTYRKRRILRRLERAWSRLETGIDRLTGSEYNPFYHLGTLGIYMLVILTVTGIYLTIFYRPGAAVAYASIERISDGWLGSLMRSIHRYASDAFMLLSVIHALKILLSDRFWGSRWLAWVSGWALVIFSWGIGTMGYWLIWDVRSQWMTEVLIHNAGSGIALTFLNPAMAASSFAAFVIVLFVHIFLPIALLFLIIVHLLRLTRGRVWSPRWLMVLAAAALVLISVAKPAVSEAPANLGRIIENVRLDAWYLGFLPVMERMGNAGFWLFVVVVFGVSIALPWLAKGKHSGPAIIHEAECSGCGLCAAECPYRAIEMEYRDDDTSRFKSIAVIHADLCTGCGLCVGTCATLGIELSGLPTETVYDNGLMEAVKRKVAGQEQPVVLFTCERHAALGSLPESLQIVEQENGSGGTPVYSGYWYQDGIRSETVSCVLPCLGMTDVNWIKELNQAGAKDVLLLGCPYDDCGYREGIMWESARLNRRKSILAPNLQWREAGPGAPRPIQEMMSVAMLPADEKKKPEIAHPKERGRRFPPLPAAGTALAILAILVALALPLDISSASAQAGQGQIRAIVQHSGVIGETAGNDRVSLPEDSTVELSQILGGTRFPIHMEIRVDGAAVFEERFEPRGVRDEGEINGMGRYTLPPGTYALEIRINDDGTDWRTVFEGEVTLSASEILTLIYDQETDAFLISAGE